VAQLIPSRGTICRSVSKLPELYIYILAIISWLQQGKKSLSKKAGGTQELKNISQNAIEVIAAVCAEANRRLSLLAPVRVTQNSMQILPLTFLVPNKTVKYPERERDRSECRG